MLFTRRRLLRTATLAGCSAAAHPLMTTVTLAEAPWQNRLVVIILRGAMDGLDVVQPWGDPALAALRPNLRPGPENGAFDLDGFYALHPALKNLMPLWTKGELAFAHAVSTPYRDKRSHFDGQDLLEAGTGTDLAPAARRDGWLNRMLQTVPGMTAETAFAVGAEDMLILSGAAPTLSWSPASHLELSAQSRLLLEQVYHDDPIFRDAAAAAMMLADEAGADDGEDGPAMGGAGAMRTAQAESAPDQLAAFAAERLKGATRIAAFSVPGWDTHRDQKVALARTLRRLQQVILTLRDGLGPVWGQTAVLAMTEFGRTARENGSRGTDHGTGGAMLMAGGAIRGGRVLGQWPGLGPSDLYAGRDLMPTADVRAYAGWAMRGLFGLEGSAIGGVIFPGLDLGGDPGLIL